MSVQNSDCLVVGSYDNNRLIIDLCSEEESNMNSEETEEEIVVDKFHQQLNKENENPSNSTQDLYSLRTYEMHLADQQAKSSEPQKKRENFEASNVNFRRGRK